MKTKTITVIGMALLGIGILNAADTGKAIPGMGVQSSEQIQKWRQNMTAEKTVEAPKGNGFYTGKLYDSDKAGYTFKFRNFDPELGRWTANDPSGFPDGANNLIYAPKLNTAVDPNGLSVTGATGPSPASATKQYMGGTFTVSAYNLSISGGSNNFTINIDSYGAFANDTFGGVWINISVTSQADPKYHWKQWINTSDPGNNQSTNSYWDTSGDPYTQYYDVHGLADTTYFSDMPTRPYSSIPSTGGTVSWDGTLQLVIADDIYGANEQLQAQIYYGFTITE